MSDEWDEVIRRHGLTFAEAVRIREEVGAGRVFAEPHLRAAAVDWAQQLLAREGIAQLWASRWRRAVLVAALVSFVGELGWRLSTGQAHRAFVGLWVGLALLVLNLLSSWNAGACCGRRSGVTTERRIGEEPPGPAAVVDLSRSSRHRDDDTSTLGGAMRAAWFGLLPAALVVLLAAIWLGSLFFWANQHGPEQRSLYRQMVRTHALDASDRREAEKALAGELRSTALGCGPLSWTGRGGRSSGTSSCAGTIPVGAWSSSSCTWSRPSAWRRSSWPWSWTGRSAGESDSASSPTSRS